MLTGGDTELNVAALPLITNKTQLRHVTAKLLSINAQPDCITQIQHNKFNILNSWTRQKHNEQ